MPRRDAGARTSPLERVSLRESGEVFRGSRGRVRIQVVMTLPREAVSVPLTRRTVAAALTAAGVTPDCLSEVEVALSEACTNVLHHAGQGEAYEVAINISDQLLTMDVIDFGAGFGEVEEGAPMPDPTAESGRGLALIRALTDQAVF